MIRIIAYILLAITVFWLPSFAWLLLAAAYTFRYHGTEVVVLAIIVDWYLVAPWPQLTLVTIVVAVSMSWLRRRFVVYTV